ncbi:MAG: leucine-rich repeat domain-containing protein [Gemmatimonadota bacterium]|nr:leucine-rich repeat domain-containing protein [Gemmatimonadota bacterium]
MIPIRPLLLLAMVTTSILAGQASLSFGQQLRLDTQIETPAQNNNALELPEKQTGDTIQFQLFAPGAAGRQIQGYTVELALKGKTFASYIDRVSGTDLNGSALLSGVSASGNPTLSMLSLSAVSIPGSGYLGQVNLSVSRALASSDVLSVQRASTAGPGGVQNLDVSKSLLTFTRAPACPGDFNGDGMVNLADFLAFAGGFGARSGDANYDSNLDMDGSGAVDLSDFLRFAGVFGTTCPTPVSPPASIIPDENLRAVIADSLGKARGVEIARAEMANLTRLVVRVSDTIDLTGLEYASNLWDLRIRANSVSNLSALSNLTNLRWLALSHLKKLPADGFDGLQNLSKLVLGYLQIETLPANVFAGLDSLEAIYVYFCRSLTSLPEGVFEGLTSLRWLYVEHNGLTALPDGVFADLAGLRELWLVGNQLAELPDGAFSNLINLEVLRLENNRLSTMPADVFTGLTRLAVLHLGNNELTDLSALAGLSNLTWLNLGGNGITDVSGLSGLTTLTELFLYDNGITDLSPLVANNGLGSRDTIDVRGNPLSATSINVHVPALEARGVSVSFDETIVFTDPRVYNGNVFVLPVSEDLSAGNLPLEKYSTRFYEYFSDAFDFLVFMPSLHWEQLDSKAFGGAYYASVKNEVQGTGQTIYFDASWGSEGKLQGAVFFAHAASSKPEHTGLVWGPGLHELMHRWANFIVGPSIPHWDFTSANGILGGFDIAKLVDHGGGRYSAPNVYTGGWARNLKPYSPIEMYLAGLIPPEQVPDLWVAEDGEIVKSGRGGDPDEFTASKVKTHTVEDIIAKHGRRVPDHTRSQKAFRAAVILLVSEDYPATRKFLEALSNDASLFSHAGEDRLDDWYNFYEATGGRATIAMDGLSAFKSTGASKRPAVRSFGTPPPTIKCHLNH